MARKKKMFKNVSKITRDNDDHKYILRMTAENMGMEHVVRPTDDGVDIFYSLAMALAEGMEISEDTAELLVLDEVNNVASDY